MKKILMTTAIAGALLFSAVGAEAHCPHKHKPCAKPGFEHMKKEWTPEQKAKMEQRRAEIDKRLNVTAEQKEQLKAIHEQSKAEIAPKIKQLTELEYELGVLMKRDYNAKKYGIATLEEVQLSGKTVDELKNEIKTLKTEIREIKKANFEKTQAVFTDEQKQEFKKMREERMEKMKKMHKMKKFHKKHKKPCGPCPLQAK